VELEKGQKQADTGHAQKNQKNILMFKKSQSIAELRKEVDPYWAWERRREYVESLMLPIAIQAFQYIALKEINNSSGNLTGSIYFDIQAKEAIKKLVKYQNELYYTRPSMKNTNGITQEMITRAKEYPFQELYEFKRGSCVCPFHADKDPSMKLYKNNTVHCFGCHKSWDTIAFLQDLKGISFVEAVRALQ